MIYLGLVLGSLGLAIVLYRLRCAASAVSRASLFCAIGLLGAALVIAVCGAMVLHGTTMEAVDAMWARNVPCPVAVHVSGSPVTMNSTL